MSTSDRASETSIITGSQKSHVKSTGTVVQSRHLQSADSKAKLMVSSAKKQSLNNKPVAVSPRLSLSTNVTQKSFSTRSSSLANQSVIAAQRPSLSKAEIKPKMGAAPANLNTSQACLKPAGHEKRKWQMKTFLLTYLTAKLESRNAKLRAQAEQRLLLSKKQLDMLNKTVHEKKHQHDLAKKEKEVKDVLDLQIACLTPVANVAHQFANYYSSLATDLVNIQHGLCVKKFYISGNKMEFLGEAENFLKKSEDLLVEFKVSDKKENGTSLECLKHLKTTSKTVNQQLAGAFSVLLELYSLACHHLINVQQAKEEAQLGDSRIRQLFCAKQ
ncbi:unnamed protein product [Ophioblennius macclurei]